MDRLTSRQTIWLWTNEWDDGLSPGRTVRHCQWNNPQVVEHLDIINKIMPGKVAKGWYSVDGKVLGRFSKWLSMESEVYHATKRREKLVDDKLLIRKVTTHGSVVEMNQENFGWTACNI